jgi:two-component system sensor histidine kinase KdpD
LQRDAEVFHRIAASVASVLIFDLLFTQPYYRITVYDSQYLVTFAVMLIVGLAGKHSHFASPLSSGYARQKRAQGRGTLSTQSSLANTAKTADLLRETEQIISEVFDSHL